MTFDYSSETPSCEFVSPPTLLSSVRLRSGQVKLFNFRAKLSDLWQIADAIPQHRPKQHVVCLHHFDRLIKFDRNLDGRTKRETTAKGDIAFLPADAPTRLRLAKDDPHRLLCGITMRVAFLTATAPGHGYPMTALARRVKARGHDVVSIGFPSAEPLVRAAELTFFPFCEKEYPAGSNHQRYNQLSRLESALRFLRLHSALCL